MSQPISIAMTSYNGDRYIEAQLQSLLQQTLPAQEIVVCDDGSADDTPAILERYAASGSIRLYRNAQQLGVIANFKQAVAHCQPGNYIALCDQDDVWLPEKLQRQSALLAMIDDGTTPAMVYSDVTLVDGQLQPLHHSFWKLLKIQPEKERLQSLLFGNFVTGCTLVMNPAMSRLFCRIPDCDVYMHDAWIAMIGFSFGKQAYSREPLVLYRQHGGNVTFETNTGSSLHTRVSDAARQIVNNEGYLQKETAMARQFLYSFRQELSPQQQQVISRFADLGQAGFLRKKLSSIFSRKYRFV